MCHAVGNPAILHLLPVHKPSSENDSHYHARPGFCACYDAAHMDVHLPNDTLPDELRDRLSDCAATIVETGAELAALGWTPATSSNFSMRLDPSHIAITASGRHKGNLSRDDILVLDTATGHALGTALKPSAETLLHLQIYRLFPGIHAVLHTHSRAQSVASRLYADAGEIRLQGWELQKAMSGFDSHDSVLTIPVFSNSQHMPDIAAEVDAWIAAGKPLHAYLVSGHGMYVWGCDMSEAHRHLEALDFLINCELDLRRLAP